MKIKLVNDKKELVEILVKYLNNEQLTIYDRLFLEEIFTPDELEDYEALEELVEVLKEELI